MKKIFVLLCCALAMISFISCSKKEVATSQYKVAMVTDYGDITDESFNQITYEAGKKFCNANKLDYKYFRPASDSTADRVTAVEQAIAEGFNVILCPGYAFAGTIVEVSPTYPDVKFIALDVAEGDILAAAIPNYDYDPSKYNVGDYYNTSSVYCAIYKEELAGYMAGYAAVKLGYKHLGFLGGMAVPAVIRYGYGYVQGANDAAKQLGIENDVTIEYVYGNQFYGDADITAYMDTWYKDKKVEVVFACGGGIYTSAAEAAKKVSGTKVIGVDVDQKPIIDAYASGLTVTSAMKGLAATVNTLLTETILNNNWSKYAGKIETLGLVSEVPEENYVGIPDSTSWNEGFSKDDYKKLVKDMFFGNIKVSDAIDAEPSTSIKVNYYGNIK
ncbi:MAG: BMP family ABC transporter substrate-binding protein [Treponemataceae bacterium]|nr:BMP family ABC transporter substrate-binding protein [Treponemataceae bacterium]